MSRSTDDPISVVGFGISSFANRVLIGHPCTVLRRQAQVHEYAKTAHLLPFNLVPVVGQLIKKDGILTLWKGSIGSGVLWAMSHVTEIVIADIFNLPKNIIQDGSRERFWRHVLLKTYTSIAMTPFIVSSFVETVRSGVEPDTNVFDVVVKGFDRLKFDLLGPRDSTKRFSVFHLIAPTVALHTANFLVYKFTYDTVYGIARGYVSRKMPENRTRFHTIMPEMFASITAGFVADLVCFPLETVVHRLYIQGTRALIDNLDNGGKAINVNFKYTGALHCVRSIIRHEGLSGFYQGVGAVLLQYSLQFCVLQALRAIFGWIDGTTKTLRIKTDSPLAFRKNSSGFLLSGRSSGDPFGSSPHSDPLSGYLAGRNAEHKTSTSNLFPSFAQTQADIYSGFQPGSSGATFSDAHSPPRAYASSLLQPATTAPGPSGMPNVIDTTKHEFDLRP